MTREPTPQPMTSTARRWELGCITEHLHCGGTRGRSGRGRVARHAGPSRRATTREGENGYRRRRSPCRPGAAAHHDGCPGHRSSANATPSNTPLASRAMEARRGGETHGKHRRTAQGDVRASHPMARDKGLLGDAVRNTGRPISDHHAVSRRGGGGRSSATAQDLSKCGKTTVTVFACHSAFLFTSWQ